jgi:hypothetical protein
MVCLPERIFIVEERLPLAKQSTVFSVSKIIVEYETNQIVLRYWLQSMCKSWLCSSGQSCTWPVPMELLFLNSSG